MITPPGPDDWIEAIKQGLTDVGNLVNALVVLHHDPRRPKASLEAAEAAAEKLTPIIAEALDRRPQLIRVLIQIVDLGVPLISYPRGDAANAADRRYMKQEVVSDNTKSILSWLAAEPDDRLREPAVALLKRLKELNADPRQWIDAYIVQSHRRGAGRPSLALKPQARALLATVGVTEAKAQLHLLRLLAIEPPPRGPAKKKPTT